MNDPKLLPPGAIAQLQETVRACGAITELNETWMGDAGDYPHAFPAQTTALEVLGLHAQAWLDWIGKE